ncbi:MAG: hypothetical protein IPO85_12335 [Saprospiraceae bacterium]|uniref:Uncharacterized protein n=1 Tax=Candidatus Defluviibacterium haderslevense TaxID=2981993 RepID=A0A9D7XI27_9BACT|nr:hypothetical protein [Candidatus Defluviibacterium haderslevense]
MGRTFRSNYTRREIIATALANQDNHLKSLKKKNTAKPVSENIKKVVETKQTKEVKKMDPVVVPIEPVASVDPLTS